MASPSFGGIVTFGSGSNQFNMEFVTIGNPGNAPDSTGDPNPAGIVDYTYDIGKFEVSRDLVTKYNSNSGVVAITLDPMSGISGGTGVNRPATGITWNEAARFVNWLNTSTGGSAAYKFTTGGSNDNIALWTAADTLDFDATNPYRSKRAKYVLPSYNEWYKAAFYDPNKSGGAGYWDYATGSDTAPTSVTGGTTANTAVYKRLLNVGPADVTNAGGLSPYDVMGLNGNVAEWEESSLDLSNSSVSSDRGHRGGAWTSNDAFDLSSAGRHNDAPDYDDGGIGFRVAMVTPSAPPAVPEPSMMVIGTLFGLGGLVAKRRMKK
jgi:formylglycine-generating enzyme required for sulfatase activity